MITWKEIGQDVVYDFSSRVNLRKTLIHCVESEDHYLRLAIEKNQNKPEEQNEIQIKYKDLSFSTSQASKQILKFDGFEGSLEKPQTSTPTYDQIILSQPTFTPKDKGITMYEIREWNLPLDQLSFVISDPFYIRRVRIYRSTEKEEEFVLHHEGWIHHLPNEKEPVSDLKLSTDQTRHLKIEIWNEDNPPLTINEIKLQWRRRNLYFYPQANQSYTLLFGNKQISAPRYETTQFLSDEQVARVQSIPWDIGEIKENMEYEEKDPEGIQKTVITLIVIGLVLLLGWWTWALPHRVIDQKTDPTEESTKS